MRPPIGWPGKRSTSRWPTRSNSRRPTTPILRERFGLSAQMAVRCIAQACEAYKRDKTKRPHFRKHAAMPFDQRMMGFKGVDRVSLLTLDGRVVVPFVMGKYQAERFERIKGQCDLVFRKEESGSCCATVDVPGRHADPGDGFPRGRSGHRQHRHGQRRQQPTRESPSSDVRRKHNLQRKRLGQAEHKGGEEETEADRRQGSPVPQASRTTSSARRSSRLPKTPDAGSPSKTSAASATGSRLGAKTLAINSPVGRSRSWSRSSTYKARLAGVPLVKVDPRNTSRTCSECGHCAKDNRKSQAKFLCVSCGRVGVSKVGGKFRTTEPFDASIRISSSSVHGGLPCPGSP